MAKLQIARGQGLPHAVTSRKTLNKLAQSSRLGTAETNLTRNHEVAGSIPGLAQWVGKGSGVAVSCGIGQHL